MEKTLKLELYSLFFSPSTWVSDENVKGVSSGTLSLWVCGALLSQVVGSMLAIEASSGIPVFWAVFGTVIRAVGFLLCAFCLTAFSVTIANWNRKSNLVTPGLIFRMVLLAFLPVMMTTPLGILSVWSDSPAACWYMGKFLIFIWTCVLLYKGFNGTFGISSGQTIVIMLFSALFVFLNIVSSFTWSIFTLILSI